MYKYTSIEPKIFFWKIWKGVWDLSRRIEIDLIFDFFCCCLFVGTKPLKGG